MEADEDEGPARGTSSRADAIGRGTASPELTGGAGFTFEDGVAAFYLAALLSESPARGMGAAVARTVRLQRGALGEPLDDVVVECDDGDVQRTLRVQVKRSFAFSATPSNAAFYDIVSRTQETIEAEGFRIGLDRCAVATEEIAVAQARHLRSTCDWARDSATAADFLARIGTVGLAAEAKRNLVSDCRKGLKQHLGVEPSDEQVFQFYRHFVLLRFDILGEGARDEDFALDRIGAALSDADRSATFEVWNRLRVVTREASGAAGSFGITTLRERLGGSQRFGTRRSLRGDLIKVAAEGQLALAGIRRDIDGFTLARDELVEQVLSAADEHRIVQIVGQPGTGKSALLRAFAETAASSGSTLVLTADRLMSGGWPAFAQRHQISVGELDDLLLEMAAGGDPVLVIDGLDRVKREDRDVILDIIRPILSDPALRAWRLVCTVRDGSLEYLRQWLPAEFFSGGSAVVEARSLSDTEANQVADALPRLRALLFGPPNVTEIARRPFFAAVLARGLTVGEAPSSETELLAAWWAHGGYDAEGSQRARRQETLLALAERGASTLGRDIAVRGLDHDAVEGLKADQLLKDAEAGISVSFQHDIFFEWSFAQSLVAARDQWLRCLIDAGEPAALGRPVELLAQRRFERDEDWQGGLAELETTAARTQWLRCWLIAPFSSPLFRERNANFDEAVLKNENGRTEKLLVWFQAVRTQPNPALLVTEHLKDSSPAERLRIADELAWPADLPAWGRMLSWLGLQGERLPISLRWDALTLMEVWQRSIGFPNPISERQLDLVAGWIEAIEDHRRPRRRVIPGRFGSLSYEEEKELADRLLGFIFGAGRVYPKFTTAYLKALMKGPDRERRAWKSVLIYADYIAATDPKLLVDALLKEVCEPLPKAKLRAEAKSEERRRRQALRYPEGSRERDLLMPLGIGGGIGMWDWNSLSLDRGADLFYPPTPDTQPFKALFTAAPAEGLRLVKSLANHAIKSWRQLCELSWDERASPIPLRLKFPWGQATYWGGAKEYFAFRAAFAPHVLEAGLMAMEDWAFRELEGGADVDELVRLVVSDCGHNAVLGIAVALAITSQRVSRATLPLASCQRLWRWDMERLVKLEMSEGNANQIGAMGKRQHLDPLIRSNTRAARSRELRSLAPLFALSGDRRLQRSFQTALAGWSLDSAFDTEEEKANAELVLERQRTAQIWSALGDPAHYVAHKTDRGIAVVFDNPHADDADVKESFKQHEALNRGLALGMWGEARFGDGKSDLTPDGAVALAMALDRPDLFQGGRQLGDLKDVERSGVAAAASHVLDSTTKDKQQLAWAEDVIIRALGSPLAVDPMVPDMMMSFHPAKRVGPGLAGLIRRKRRVKEATEALFALLAVPSHEVSVEAAKAIYSLARERPVYVSAALHLILRLSIRRDLRRQYWNNPAGAAEARNQDTLEALSETIEAVQASISLPLPTLPAPPAPLVEQNAAGVGYEDSDDEEDEAAVDGTRYLDVNFLKGHLAAMRPDQAPPGIANEASAFGLALLDWTVAKAAGEAVLGRDTVSQMQFRHTLMDWAAQLSFGMKAEDSIKRILTPICSLPDEQSLELIQPFLSSYMATVFDHAVEDAAAVNVLTFLAERVARTKLGRNSRMDLSLHYATKNLLLVTDQNYGLSTRFANGDYRELHRYAHVIDIMVQGLGRSRSFVELWLSLVERAVEHYPSEPFSRQAQHILDQFLDRKSLRSTTIPSRIATLVHLLAERDQPLSPDLAGAFLRILDRLIDEGDRRAAALQAGDLFRRVPRPTPAAA